MALIARRLDSMPEGGSIPPSWSVRTLEINVVDIDFKGLG